MQVTAWLVGMTAEAVYTDGVTRCLLAGTFLVFGGDLEKWGSIVHHSNHDLIKDSRHRILWRMWRDPACGVFCEAMSEVESNCNSTAQIKPV